MKGSVFHSWTVVADPVAGQPKVACRCNCGRTSDVDIRNLERGLTRQCRPCSTDKSCRKHAGTLNGNPVERLYRIWKNMKYRCRETRKRERPYYADRHITVCLEWAKDYVAFRDWALANGYRDDRTLDRRDNNGLYSPDNCRWAT